MFQQKNYQRKKEQKHFGKESGRKKQPSTTILNGCDNWKVPTQPSDTKKLYLQRMNQIISKIRL